MKEFFDICYREINGLHLRLDLFLPDTVGDSPLILWIHGGGWNRGDRKSCRVKRQVGRGYAVASVDYRLSGKSLFPAQIEDCKYALAYLRKRAGHFGYDPSRIAVGGDSAGGHLAALMGTTAGHADWEPEDADCSVQAVLDYYGPTAFSYRWPHAMRTNSVEEQLLGEPLGTKRGRMLAEVASPVSYICGDEPPFLILHGESDTTVPISQSILLRDALEQAGSKAFLYTAPGGKHGFQSLVADVVADEFLDYFLLKRKL